MKVLTSQETVEWGTNPDLLERIREFFGGVIDLDPASNDWAQKNVKAKSYFTKQTDGLNRSWKGFNKVFINPPFDNVPKWVNKILNEWFDDNIKEAVLLVNSAPGYVWWEDLWRAVPVLMLEKREKFLREDGKPAGQAKKGQSLFLFPSGPDRIDTFIEVFEDLGRIILPD